MRKYFVLLAILLFCSLSVSAANVAGVVCNSSLPEKIVARANWFEDGLFFIRFSNETGGSVEIVSFEYEANLVINEQLSGIVKEGESVQINGRYSKDVGFIQDHVFIDYINSENIEEHVNILCIGYPSISTPTSRLNDLIYATLPYFLFLLGLVFVIFGHLKEKKLIRNIGFVLLIIAIFLFLGFPWILY